MKLTRRSSVKVTGILVAVFMLGACSTSTSTTPPESSTSATPTSDTVEFAYVGELAATEPVDGSVHGEFTAKWRTPAELSFTSYGSSSCYWVPTTVGATGAQDIRIVVVYGAVASPGIATATSPLTACTSDFAPTTFVLKNPGTNRAKRAKLTVVGQTPGQPQTETTVTVAPYVKA